MNRDEKAAVVDEVAAQIEESQAIIAVDYRGISRAPGRRAARQAARGRRDASGSSRTA